MIDLGKGVSVDVLKHPYVFGIDGWDPIRIQKGTGRITGATVEQLKLIITTVEGSADEQKHNHADNSKNETGKNRATGRRNTRPPKGNGHKSR